MAVISCPVGIDCSKLSVGIDGQIISSGTVNDFDFPITNYSSEGPEQQPHWDSLIFPNDWDKMGCLALCTSTVSQNAADLCALAQEAQCPPVNPPCVPFCGPVGPCPPFCGPPPITFFLNHATSCSCVCAGGSEFFYFVPAGIFSGQTQAIADALANAFCHAQCSTACEPPGVPNPVGGLVIGPVPAGCLNTAYSQAIPRTRPVVAWIISSGSLPPGLTLNGSTGVIAGTPTVSGGFVFQVRAYNVDGNYAQRIYGLCIIDLSPATLPDGEVGVAYLQTVSATGCAPGTKTWQVTSGLLPDGLTLNATTGVISGTPTFDTTYNFVVSVTSATYSCQKAYSLRVNPCTNITNASPLPDADEGMAYSQQLNSLGITNPVWSIIAGALPTGLNLSASGLISGTPTVANTFNFTAQVTGDNGTCGKAFALTVLAADLCPAWDTMLWDTETSSAIGAGTFLGSWLFEDFSAQVSSPGGGNDTAQLQNNTATPLGLVYNGPGCNCNLHVDLISVSGGATEVSGLVQVLISPPGTILAQFTTPPDGVGSYDIPFAVPDTLGLDINLFVFVSVQSGLDPGIFTASDVNLSGFVENLP